MKILIDGLLKAHLKAVDGASLDSSVQDCGMKFDEILRKIDRLLGPEHNEIILGIEASMNEYAFANSFAVYKQGVSDGIHIQQEINALAPSGENKKALCTCRAEEALIG